MILNTIVSCATCAYRLCYERTDSIYKFDYRIIAAVSPTCFLELTKSFLQIYESSSYELISELPTIYS